MPVGSDHQGSNVSSHQYTSETCVLSLGRPWAQCALDASRARRVFQESHTANGAGAEWNSGGVVALQCMAHPQEHSYSSNLWIASTSITGALCVRQVAECKRSGWRCQSQRSMLKGTDGASSSHRMWCAEAKPP